MRTPRRAIFLALIGLAISACGHDRPDTLITPDDFDGAKGDVHEADGGIVGMPPCRALRYLNQDLNLNSAGRVTGSRLALDDASVFAVVFGDGATRPSPPKVVAGIPELVSKCAGEIAGDSTRTIEKLDDLPRQATGYRGQDHTSVTEYAYTVTSDDRLLVVGSEYAAGDDSPVAMKRLLDIAADRVPEVAGDADR